MDIPKSRNGPPKIWRLRSGYLENWPDWAKHDIVSVGWNIGRIRRDVTEERAISDEYETLEEVGDRVEELIKGKFFEEDGESDPSNAYGTVKTVTATRRDRYFSPDDFVIVFGHQIRGQPVIHGVARLKEYVGKKFEIKKESHPYQWKVKYLAKGPIRKHDLSERFDGGPLDLFLQSTLWEFHDATVQDVYKLATEINNLIDQGKQISLSQSYFNYKEIDMQRYIGDNISDLREGISKTVPKYWINGENRADFYCELEDSGVLIIETKQEHATPDNIEQLLGYMQEYKHKEDREVEALLIASGFLKETISLAQINEITLRRFVPFAEFPEVN